MSIRDSMSQKEMNRWNNMTEQEKRDIMDPAGRLLRENSRLKTEIAKLRERVEDLVGELLRIHDEEPDIEMNLDLTLEEVTG